jgi:hypothetical protein
VVNISVDSATHRTQASSVSLEVALRPWTTTAETTEEQIAALWKHIAELEGRVVRRSQEQRIELRASIAEPLDKRITELDKRQALREQENTEFEVRGILAIVFGTLLAGFPGSLVLLPWHLGWVVIAGGAVVALWAASTLLTRRR